MLSSSTVIYTLRLLSTRTDSLNAFDLYLDLVFTQSRTCKMLTDLKLSYLFSILTLLVRLIYVRTPLFIRLP